MALVLAELLAADALDSTGKNREGQAQVPGVAGHELTGALAPRHEADLLAFSLFRRRQPGAPGVSAHFVLAELSDRKSGCLELFWGQVIKKVGLVLVGILPLPKHRPSRDRVSPAARVVSGRDGFAAHHARALPERGEFHLRVAGRTGNRSLAGQIRLDEGSDDAGAKLLLEVQDVMRDVQRPGHPPGIGQIVERAAASGAPRLARVIPELHREANDLVPFLFEEQSGNGRIHAARHGNRDAHAGHCKSLVLGPWSLVLRPRTTD